MLGVDDEIHYTYQNTAGKLITLYVGYQQPHSWHQNMAEMLHRVFSMTSPALSFLL